MKYQLLPPLTAEERAGLTADIKARGVLVPVEKDENGDILDGHNRAAIADELGIDYPVIVRHFGSEQEKREHVLKINLVRRHLDPVRWGLAFQKLLEEKGVHAERGPKPDGSISLTVSEIAAEVGVPASTARRRVAVAKKYDALPEKQKEAVDSGKKTVHKAHREEQRRRTAPESSAPTGGAVTFEMIHADVLAPHGLYHAVPNGTAAMAGSHLPGFVCEAPTLIFADPPYNVGIDYGDGPEADSLLDEDYLRWVERWLTLCHDRLTPHGTIWVLIGDEYADHYGVLLSRVGFHRRAWIKWYETFGVCNSARNNFSRCSRHLFYCVKDPKRFTWHPEAVMRSSDRQTKYADARAEPDGKVWDDVWQIPRLTGTCAERLPDFPTQLPLALLLPIVGATSDPGDLVVDPFAGSATSGVAALRLGRRWRGLEKQLHFARLALQRLQGEGADGTTTGDGHQRATGRAGMGGGSG